MDSIHVIKNLNSNNPTLLNKDKYMTYIHNHRANVALAFEYCEEYLKTILSDAQMEELAERIKVHDLSKFQKKEFHPYRRHFYPVDDQEAKDSEKDFEKAKKHHFKVNSHHPQHYANKENMPLVAKVEMCLDVLSFQSDEECSKDYYMSELEKYPTTTFELDLFNFAKDFRRDNDAI